MSAEWGISMLWISQSRRCATKPR